VHFDHAPVQNSKRVTEKRIEEGLKKMFHPASSPHPSPCDNGNQPRYSEKLYDFAFI
jgi:hypothetical protein